MDDLTLPEESPFQPGIIGTAVDSVSSQGVLYFSAAGNTGSRKHNTAGTWEGDFLSGGWAGQGYDLVGEKAEFHVFDKKQRSTFNTVDTLKGAHATVRLFWSDPLGHRESEYDLYRVRGAIDGKNNSGQVIDESTDRNLDPYQFLPGFDQGDSIVIVRIAEDGATNSRFLHVVVSADEGAEAVLRYPTEGSVRGHNASEAAISVAAIDVPKKRGVAVAFRGGATIAVEKHSADGPRHVFYDTAGAPITPGNFSSKGGKILPKPDVTAATGVSTTLPKGPLNPFGGTSAAAAHAAGIAALILSCSPRPSPAEVRQALEHKALPLDGKTPNHNAGYGIAMAAASVQSVMKATGCRGAPM